MPSEDLHRVEIKAQTVEQLRAFLDGSDLDLGCRPSVRRRADGLLVEAYGTLGQITGLRSARAAAGVSVEVRENASAVGRARQAEVGSVNRFAIRQPPRGLGIKE